MIGEAPKIKRGMSKIERGRPQMRWQDYERRAKRRSVEDRRWMDEAADRKQWLVSMRVAQQSSPTLPPRYYYLELES